MFAVKWGISLIKWESSILKNYFRIKQGCLSDDPPSSCTVGLLHILNDLSYSFIGMGMADAVMT